LNYISSIILSILSIQSIYFLADESKSDLAVFSLSILAFFVVESSEFLYVVVVSSTVVVIFILLSDVPFASTFRFDFLT
jgi:hypothetical protein